MDPRQSVNPRHLFIDARIVFHRGGTERVKAVVDRVIPGGKASEMPDRVHFAHFRKILDFAARVPRPEHGSWVDRRYIEVWKLIAHLAGRTPLEQERLILRDVRPNLL